MNSCRLAVDSTSLPCSAGCLWFRRGPPRCVRNVPALLRVVKSRLFLALRREGKRKCRPSPQMRNGAYTTTPSADVSNAEHAPLMIPRSFYCRQARMYMGRRRGRRSPLAPRSGEVVSSGLLWRRFPSPDHAPTTRDRSMAPTRRHTCEDRADTARQMYGTRPRRRMDRTCARTRGEPSLPALRMYTGRASLHVCEFGRAGVG